MTLLEKRSTTYKREWRRANPEKVRAATERYRVAHPEALGRRRERYLRDRDIQREQFRGWQRRRAARNTVDLNALKLLRGCADCGYDDNAAALEFDHLPGAKKRAAVSTLKTSDAYLIAEIAKCEVVCANCHSIRTASRRKVA